MIAPFIKIRTSKTATGTGPHRRRKSRGQSLVEFAVVFPVFMLVLSGILDFGFMLYSRMTVISATREGARAAITQGDAPSVIPQRVSDAVDNAVSGTGLTDRQPAEAVHGDLLPRRRLVQLRHRHGCDVRRLGERDGDVHLPLVLPALVRVDDQPQLHSADGDRMNTRSRGVLAAMRDGGIGRRRTGKSGEREGGQIIVLFALSIVVMFVFAAIVVDLGVLRNNKQTLVNSVDAAALAGGTVMPVDGSDTTLDANGKTPRQAAYDLIKATLIANYGTLGASQYQITYRCLIGIDKSTPAKPNVIRDVPIVCDPSHSLNWNGSTTVAQKQAFFTGAGNTRSSSCDPFAGDKCNTVVVQAATDTSYSFGRVVGVNSGSSGAIQSAACNGPCGQPPSTPVDLVMIIDRTGSMQTSADPSGTAVTSAAAKAVLGVYDPSLQRVALGLLGPSSTTETCNGTGGPAVKAVLATNFSNLTAPTRLAVNSARMARPAAARIW